MQIPVTTTIPKKRLIIILVATLVPLILVIAALVWYYNAIKPVGGDTSQKQLVQIVVGSSPSQIGETLEEAGVIRSSFAFDVYTRIHGTRSNLQAGSYRLSAGESVEQIVAHLVGGRVDQYSLTFFPGATLEDTSDTPENEKTDITSVLLRAGFSKAEIKEALAKKYDHPLFASKPLSASLEGYVYGETYSFATEATLEQILTRTFDEYYKTLQDGGLIDGFKKQGLSLYEGITLASIIQREVPGAGDQKQVAQVFLKRLSIDMPLGSDVTYQYAARKMGVAPTPALKSPYNTRIVKGLPPGPIASPGKTSLEAVAHPAKGNFLYFLSGDDDVTYFSRTVDEHEAAIKNHCAIKCSVF